MNADNLYCFSNRIKVNLLSFSTQMSMEFIQFKLNAEMNS